MEKGVKVLAPRTAICAVGQGGRPAGRLGRGAAPSWTERAGRCSASEPGARGPCSPLLRGPAAPAPLWPGISADPHPHFRGPLLPETPSPPIQRQTLSFRSSAGLSHRLEPLGAGRGLPPRRMLGADRWGPHRGFSPLLSASGAHGRSHFFFAPRSLPWLQDFAPGSSFPSQLVRLFRSPPPASAATTAASGFREARGTFLPPALVLSVSSLFPSPAFHRIPPLPRGCHSSPLSDSFRPRPFTGLSRALPAAYWLAPAGRR